MAATIYVLCDPRTEEVRYVGVTSKSLKSRLRGHMSDATNGVANHRANWIRSLIASGVRPEIVPIETVDGDGFNREREVIAEYRLAGHALVNATDGGEGTTGYCPSTEARAKLSDAAKQMWSAPGFRARAIPAMRAAMTPERNAKVSASHLGARRSDTTRQSIAEAIADYWKTQSQKARSERAAIASAGRTQASWDRISAAMSLRRGWKHSPETKAKMAASARDRWAARKLEQESYVAG